MTTYRMPATGEAWRHHKGNLYTVVGVGTDAVTGAPTVVYTPFGGMGTTSRVQGLFARPLEDFLRTIEVDLTVPGIPRHERKEHVPRFAFEREDGCDPECPFIFPQGMGRQF